MAVISVTFGAKLTKMQSMVLLQAAKDTDSQTAEFIAPAPRIQLIYETISGYVGTGQKAKDPSAKSPKGADKGKFGWGRKNRLVPGQALTGRRQALIDGVWAGGPWAMSARHPWPILTLVTLNHVFETSGISQFIYINAGADAEPASAMVRPVAAAESLSLVPADQAEVLPPGWEVKQSAQYAGRSFYVKAATGETRWDRPPPESESECMAGPAMQPQPHKYASKYRQPSGFRVPTAVSAAGSEPSAASPLAEALADWRPREYISQAVVKTGFMLRHAAGGRWQHAFVAISGRPRTNPPASPNRHAADGPAAGWQVAPRRSFGSSWTVRPSARASHRCVAVGRAHAPLLVMFSVFYRVC